MKKKFYITTPIYYVNDIPHIGHAYTTIASDILARWHKLLGEDVFFSTGADEYGQKVEKAAKAAKMEPKKFVDSVVERFKKAWEILNISNNAFIRTTSPEHQKAVDSIIKKISADIFEGKYKGPYCVQCESYWTEKELVNGKCPSCGRGVEIVEEESYFFRLSKYQKKLLELYDSQDFILPANRKQEIYNRVKEKLNDLCITRTNFKWGVPFCPDKKCVCYVWIDALTNYLSAVGYPDEKYKKYWPADIHLIGKEILWFHAVIWPAILMSAGLPLPKKIFAHGWMTVDGEKMSKSLGNAIDPLYLTKEYGVDALRYFLLREIPFGQDGDFKEASLNARYHDELADKLGNLVSRVCGLLLKNFEGKLGFAEAQDELIDQLQLDAIKEEMKNLRLDRALASIFSYIDACNIFIQEKKPWEIKDKEELKNIMYSLVESLRVISILLSPFMPETCDSINKQFGFKKGSINDCKFGLTKSVTVEKQIILFKKIEKENKK